MAAVAMVVVVILEPKKIKFVTASTFPPFIYQEVMGLDTTILVFLNGEFQANFFTLTSPSSRSSLVPLHFLSLE